MNKKIISVIGGSGFIGNYLVDKLLDSGYYVKVISRKSKSNKKCFLPKRCHLLHFIMGAYEGLHATRPVETPRIVVSK